MLLAKEVISPTTLVWRPGRGTWREFQEVAGQAPKPEPKQRKRWMAGIFGVTVFLAALAVIRQATVGTEQAYVLDEATPKARTVALERIRQYRPDQGFFEAVRASPPVPFAAAARPLLPEERLDLEFWQSAQLSDGPEDYETYLQRYPSGAFAEIAEARIEALRKPVAKRTRKRPPKNPEIASAPATKDARTAALKAAPAKPSSRGNYLTRKDWLERCGAGDVLSCQRLQRLGD
jgi:hypothetical protein